MTRRVKPSERRPRGRPPAHDGQRLLADFLTYIRSTNVPIVAEFAYRNGIHRQQLYEIPELSDAIRFCITKKEADLERGALTGILNHTMAIFSLKQLGWRDKQEVDVGDGLLQLLQGWKQTANRLSLSGDLLDGSDRTTAH